MKTPDVPDLPFEMDAGVKVFRLRAEPVTRKLVPFKTMTVWGYNGSCPGPTIQVQQGDRVRVIFENGLPESTTVHWHGLEVPIEMDGVPYISQKPIPPGQSFTYEFTVHQEGTFFYHSHGAMQEMMGMLGMFISHPSKVPQATSGPRFRNCAAGVGHSAEPGCSEYGQHGIQLAHLQRRRGTIHHPDDRPPRQSRADAHRKPGHGSPSDPSAWSSIRHHRHGRRPRTGKHLVPDQYCPGRRRASQGRGVRSEVPGRLDGPLPFAAPHDEQHVGPVARPANRHRRPNRRPKH